MMRPVNRLSFIPVCCFFRLLCVSASACLSAYAQSNAPKIVPDFSWRVWTQRDGLPSNEITSLGQDRDGYLYIGTPAGLARFDGHTFSPVTGGEDI